MPARGNLSLTDSHRFMILGSNALEKLLSIYLVEPPKTGTERNPLFLVITFK